MTHFDKNTVGGGSGCIWENTLKIETIEWIKILFYMFIYTLISLFDKKINISLF